MLKCGLLVALLFKSNFYFFSYQVVFVLLNKIGSEIEKISIK